ncbi:hypothetical protein STRIP9103_08951 [Streptomyces ipomoeae 91-03]|uniref:Uncharacterized protein n=1 Tax=Streptomyces ipomoeae 91-03 TaxID=698759 RepID=L1KZM0_9ACTN|nr:hypothetical protein STRIP9103_08951 [Streptomyces ipomoeae 91-03]
MNRAPMSRASSISNPTPTKTWTTSPGSAATDTGTSAPRPTHRPHHSGSGR